MDFDGAAALKASPAYDCADVYFETVVSGVESSGNAKREAVAGIGTRPRSYQESGRFQLPCSAPMASSASSA